MNFDSDFNICAFSVYTHNKIDRWQKFGWKKSHFPTRRMDVFTQLEVQSCHIHTERLFTKTLRFCGALSEILFISNCVDIALAYC